MLLQAVLFSVESRLVCPGNTSEVPIAFIDHILFTVPVLLGALEKRFAAGIAVVPVTFGPRPFAAAAMITEF